MANVKSGNTYIDSQLQADHRAESLGNSEQQISSPPPCPLPMEHSPEGLITGA